MEKEKGDRTEISYWKMTIKWQIYFSIENKKIKCEGSWYGKQPFIERFIKCFPYNGNKRWQLFCGYSSQHTRLQKSKRVSSFKIIAEYNQFNTLRRVMRLIKITLHSPVATKLDNNAVEAHWK